MVDEKLKFDNSQYVRETLIVDNITYIADVVPYGPHVTLGFFNHKLVPRKGYSFGYAVVQTNFIGWSVDMLEIHHPTLGIFDKQSIGKRFKVKGSPFKWKIRALHVGQLELEADIICGLFTRKIYKFI